MRAHLFEFHSQKKRLTCLCGWERVMKTADLELAYERFREHTEEVARERAAVAAR